MVTYCVWLVKCQKSLCSRKQGTWLQDRTTTSRHRSTCWFSEQKRERERERERERQRERERETETERERERERERENLRLVASRNWKWHSPTVHDFLSVHFQSASFKFPWKSWTKYLKYTKILKTTVTFLYIYIFFRERKTKREWQCNNSIFRTCDQSWNVDFANTT